MKQETFMMLKPDAFAEGHYEEVLTFLEEHGLKIEKKSMVRVCIEDMETLIKHYEDVINHMPKEFNFPGKLFNTFYYDGPHLIMPMKITYEGNEDIIEYTRKLAGKTNPKDADPNSIRGKFSDDNYEKADKDVRLVNNIIHASDSKESARRELAIWSHYLG